ncbi:MAG: hypothetical protein H5T86_12315 [Armatimonadetes bacterium]|nr:hypothetical protein [Armatimonadota bacterium]
MGTDRANRLNEPPTPACCVEIDAAGVHYSELNALIRSAIHRGAEHIKLFNVNGQRYIGAGLRAPVLIEVFGVPGNDLAAFNDGAELIVHANAQDGVANTMNAGRVVVHGDAGDVTGYAMRGGKVFIRGDAGYRVGIHMKENATQKPVLVIGGTAADFLGEYQAGGTLIVLGLTDTARRGRVAGDYTGTGMHGGVMYLRGKVDPLRIATKFVALTEASDENIAAIEPILREFCEAFGYDLDEVLNERFWQVRPISHKPFASNYAPNP